MVLGLEIWKGFFLHVESYRWCMGLPAMAYMNQKAVSSYILLQVKPKLPDMKIGSCRFLDAMGGDVGLVAHSIQNCHLTNRPLLYRSVAGPK